MKNAELMKKLRQLAKSQGQQLEITEGGKHTKVQIGDRKTTVPRHTEINELTAKRIWKQMGGEI